LKNLRRTILNETQTDRAHLCAIRKDLQWRYPNQLMTILMMASRMLFIGRRRRSSRWNGAFGLRRQRTADRRRRRSSRSAVGRPDAALRTRTTRTEAHRSSSRYGNAFVKTRLARHLAPRAKCVFGPGAVHFSTRPANVN